MPTAIIPQIEDVRWICTIPTGSSMCRRSRSGRTAIEKTDEMEPMTRACHGRETAQIAGITGEGKNGDAELIFLVEDS